MLKFVLILALVFSAFYFGGAVLFDSGISGNTVGRVPAAVQVERVYKSVNKTAVSVIKIVDFYIAPAREALIKKTSSVPGI